MIKHRRSLANRLFVVGLVLLLQILERCAALEGESPLVEASSEAKSEKAWYVIGIAREGGAAVSTAILLLELAANAGGYTKGSTFEEGAALILT